jgi:hypothetical protein
MRDFEGDAEKAKAVARDEALTNSNDTVFSPYATDFVVVFRNTTNCTTMCGSREHCVDGHCHCREGFRGNKCEVAVCPDECSGNGICRKGSCLCDIGYSGIDCATRELLTEGLPSYEYFPSQTPHIECPCLPFLILQVHALITAHTVACA